jgi:hypothetical protein
MRGAVSTAGLLSAGALPSAGVHGPSTTRTTAAPLSPSAGTVKQLAFLEHSLETLKHTEGLLKLSHLHATKALGGRGV